MYCKRFLGTEPNFCMLYVYQLFNTEVIGIQLYKFLQKENRHLEYTKLPINTQFQNS